jgi:DNA-binding MarR family transcriptional regulator
MGSQASAAAVMIALRRIVRYLRIADREAESAVGLSAAQLFVLHALHERPASSLAEVAERTLTDQSSVSTVVAKLAASRLVARKVSPEDRRRSELRLTPAGERLLRRAPRMPQMRIADVVGELTPSHREQLVASLDRLVAAIGAHEVAPRMLFEDEPGRVAARRSRSRVRE